MPHSVTLSEEALVRLPELQRVWANEDGGPQMRTEPAYAPPSPSIRPSRFMEDIENAYTRFDSVDHANIDTITEAGNMIPDRRVPRRGLMAAIKARLLSIGHCIKKLMRRSKKQQQHQVYGSYEPKDA